MKYIERWALMRSSRTENLSEHAMEVAMIAHALCIIGNVRFQKHLDAERAATIGLFHDASETITGDMPTPVKYSSDEIRCAYKQVEAIAAERLLSRLPEDLRPVYRSILLPAEHDSDQDSRYLLRLVKAADKISALIKCIEEETTGNTEFRTAKKHTAGDPRDGRDSSRVDCFTREFLLPTEKRWTNFHDGRSELTREEMKRALRLYAVTDRRWLKAGEGLSDVLEPVLKSGVTMVQLREKELSDEAFLREAAVITALCRSYRVPCIINDRVDIALAVGADGVHVGQSDIRGRDIRALIGPERILGITAKTLEQAKAAEIAGADYIGTGAVFGSSTKSDALAISPTGFDPLQNPYQSRSLPSAALIPATFSA